MKTTKSAILTILLVLVFVSAAFLPDATALAQDTRGLAAPTPKSPHGTILDTTPTYKWTKVTGATVYRYQVYKGTTLVLDKSPDSGVCGVTYCEKTPTFTLGTNVYKWRVKAYKSGVWSAWSAYMTFTVSAASFDNQFNGAMGGWARKSGGTWAISEAKYLWTIGQVDKYSAALKTGKLYSDFDYSARVWRYGTNTTYICARMGTKVSTDDRWYPGYIFGYENYGNYAVFRLNSDNSLSIIQPWTPSAAIVKNNWNVLRVVAKGEDFWYYINGTLVKTFSDNTFKRGYVGVMAWRSASATQYSYYIDYAKLTVIETPQ